MFFRPQTCQQVGFVLKYIRWALKCKLTCQLYYYYHHQHMNGRATVEDANQSKERNDKAELDYLVIRRIVKEGPFEGKTLVVRR